MCDRSKSVWHIDEDEVTIEWDKVWPQLLARHATCMPSRDCVVDAILSLVVPEGEK